MAAIDGTARLILVLALAPAVGLGVARFAYALVLPDMQASLGWTYVEAGFMNTANAAGYLAGALASPRLARRLAPGVAVRVGTLACLAGLALSAATVDFALLSAARLVAGAGSALAFVAGGAMAAALAGSRPERAGFLLGLFYAGPGLGILVSGLVAPLVLHGYGAGAWREAWAVLALACIIPAAALFLPLAPLAAASGRSRRAPAVPLLAMAPMLVGYGAFGAGYIAYMTFMIAWVRDAGGGAVQQAAFWGVLGLAVMASPWLWSRPIGSLGGGRAIAALTGITLAGAVLPLVADGAVVLFVSSACFGSAFFAVVAATTAFVRRNLPQPAWPGGIAAATVAFGLGQMAGPVATGLVTDLAGGALSAGLWASAGLLALAAAVSLAQRDVGLHRASGAAPAP